MRNLALKADDFVVSKQISEADAIIAQLKCDFGTTSTLVVFKKSYGFGCTERALTKEEKGVLKRDISCYRAFKDLPLYVQNAYGKLHA